MTATYPRAETDPLYGAGGATDAELVAAIVASGLRSVRAIDNEAFTLAADDDIIEVESFAHGQQAQNENQGVSWDGSATTGTFTLTFDGEETGEIDIASPTLGDDILAALEALPNIAPGDVEVSGSGGDWYVEFQGALAAQDVPEMTATGTLYIPEGVNLWLGFTAPPWVATGGDFTLTFDGQTTAPIAYNATAADIQTALEALSNIDPGDVVVTGGPLPNNGALTRFQGQYEGINVPDMVADGTNLTGNGVPQGAIPPWPSSMQLQGGQTDTPTVVTTSEGQSDILVQNERQQVDTLNHPQLGGASDGTFTLTFDGQTTAPIDFDEIDTDPSGDSIKAKLEALSNIAPGDVIVEAYGQQSFEVEFQGQYEETNVPEMVVDGSALDPPGAFVLVTTQPGGVVPDFVRCHVPANADVPIPVGTEITAQLLDAHAAQGGQADVFIVPADGVKLIGSVGGWVGPLADPWALSLKDEDDEDDPNGVVFRKRAADEWVLTHARLFAP